MSKYKVTIAYRNDGWNDESQSQVVINHSYSFSCGTWPGPALFTSPGISIVKRLSESISHLCHGMRSYIFFINFHCTIFSWKCLRNPHMPWHWVVAPMISIRLIKPINLLKQFSEAAATPRQRWTKPWRYIAQRRVWLIPSQIHQKDKHCFISLP